MRTTDSLSVMIGPNAGGEKGRGAMAERKKTY